NGAVKLWDPVKRSELASLSERGTRVSGLAFSPDGRSLAGAGSGNNLTLWDVKTRSERVSVRQAHGADILSVAFSSDSRLLATYRAEGVVRVGDASPPPAVVDVRPPRPPEPSVPRTEPGETVSLPSAVHEVCVGGGGRFLILHLQRERKLAVFDANKA